MGAELFHADRQKDMAERTVSFRDSANAPKNDRTDAQCECMDCTYYINSGHGPTADSFLMR
jgi:hypothetical protein